MALPRDNTASSTLGEAQSKFPSEPGCQGVLCPWRSSEHPLSGLSVGSLSDHGRPGNALQRRGSDLWLYPLHPRCRYLVPANAAKSAGPAGQALSAVAHSAARMHRRLCRGFRPLRWQPCYSGLGDAVCHHDRGLHSRCTSRTDAHRLLLVALGAGQSALCHLQNHLQRPLPLGTSAFGFGSNGVRSGLRGTACQFRTTLRLLFHHWRQHGSRQSTTAARPAWHPHRSHRRQ